MLRYEMQYPIILPHKHWITKLIVKSYHEKGEHIAGVNHVLSEIHTRYWIIAACEAIRKCERGCMKCRKIKAKPASQMMAPLPKRRLDMSMHAFAHCAIDFGGPIITVQGRGKRREKGYLCLFTSLAT